MKLQSVLTIVLTAMLLSGCALPLSYLNVEERERPVPAGQEAQMAEPAPSSGVIDAEIHAYLQAHLQTGRFMGAVLVARGDKVIHSAGYGMADLEHDAPNTPHTRFRLGSLSKQFTAAAILQLQDQGQLDIADPISSYLPDYPGGEQITVRHLLAHTSGIPNFTTFSDLVQIAQQPSTLIATMARFADLPLEFAPGSQYSYSNSNYIVLSAIIEAVSGQSYADYMEEELFTPLGLEDTGYDRTAAIIEDRADGYLAGVDGFSHAAYVDMSVPAGGGALYSTVLDLYDWGQMLLSGRVRAMRRVHSSSRPWRRWSAAGDTPWAGRWPKSSHVP